MRSLLLVILLAVPAAAQQPSCVQVWDGPLASGSGTVVRKNFVLTNRHMVEKNAPRIITQDLKEYVGQVRKVSTRDSVDLALIQVPELPLAPVVLAPSPTYSKVRQWGFPKGLFRFTEGYPTETRGGDSFFYTSQTDHGDSGAGVFDNDGRLVGVQWGAIDKDSSGAPLPKKTSVAVTLENIKRFLGPTIQVVTTRNCAPCEKLKKELPNVLLDTQVSTNNPYGVEAFPTLILFDQDFKEVKRTSGYMTAEQINQWAN